MTVVSPIWTLRHNQKKHSVNKFVYAAAMQTLGSFHYTEKERQLISCLALAIAGGMREVLRCEPGIEHPHDCYVHHNYQSDFEIACKVLWQLGVTIAAFATGRGPIGVSFAEYYETNTKKRFPPYFLLRPDHEIEQLIAREPSASWPPMEELIEAYLRIATRYGPDSHSLLPTPRSRPFAITRPEQELPMGAFVNAGYAVTTEDGFVWTDKAAEVMIRIWLWDETDVDWSSVDEEKVLKQTLAIMASLESDETANQKLYLWNLSIAYRGLEILQKWNGKGWSCEGLKAPHFTYDEAMAISAEMAKEP